MTPMNKNLYGQLKADGTISHISSAAALLCGIPSDSLVGHALTEFVIPEHRTRYDCEVDAILNGVEQHGRVSIVVTGADGIGRRLIIQMTKGTDSAVDLFFSAYVIPDSFKSAPRLLLLRTGRLLPVARRLLSTSRRAATKEELLESGLKVLKEATKAKAGAAIEWGNLRTETPRITVGDFNASYLKGIYRAAIMARLTRGDVVVKDSSIDGNDTGSCLLILPLLSTQSPLGIIVLDIDRESELVPEEQQSLVILGEIIGLGLKALTTMGRPSRPFQKQGGDMEATDALGRLSAGFVHEINNAATVLRNNIEQLLLRGENHSLGTVTKGAIRDSRHALDAVQELTVALKAFAPEETSLFEKVDLLRIMEMVNRAVRFYAKRGIHLTLERPEMEIPLVRARSHHLIRVLFLVFAELFEASLEAGIEFELSISFKRKENTVALTIAVITGPFSLPTVLLGQLEKGGALAQQVTEAGGRLSHTVDHKGNLFMNISLPEAAAQSQSRPSNMTPVSPYRRGTILIVDDEVAVIRSLRRVLDQYHDILAARSGEEALDIIKANSQIEAILYDVSMPRLGGVEFYDEVKRQSPNYLNRIIFVKAGSYDHEMTEFLATTTNVVIDKPFDLPMLNDVLASMLN